MLVLIDFKKIPDTREIPGNFLKLDPRHEKLKRSANQNP